MRDFIDLLRTNRNYRYTWTGQVVSEIGDHFNNIAVFSLAMREHGSGAVVAGVMLARAIPVVLVGPLAGVLLDRMDRRELMIISDLVRMVTALLFLLTIGREETWLLYALSAVLMAASPFFTSGRAALLPAIATSKELHAANSLTQTTQWTTTAIGAYLGGQSVASFGYEWAFILNSVSFFVSACCIWRLRAPRNAGFRAERRALTGASVMRPLHEYREGLRYLASQPLLLAVALVGVGWATGGGAAQILFSLFGEAVFHRGAAGIGEIWACAGLGLVAGGAVAHVLGKRLSFAGYKRAIPVAYVVHGGAYVLFSLMPSYAGALFFIGLSRAAVAVSSVLNFSQLLRHVSDEYRGRVFATIETMVWGVMMLSMTAAGWASTKYSPREIGVVSGLLSSTTAFFWAWANWKGRLTEPEKAGIDPDEIEMRDEQTL